MDSIRTEWVLAAYQSGNKAPDLLLILYADGIHSLKPNSICPILIAFLLLLKNAGRAKI